MSKKSTQTKGTWKARRERRAASKRRQERNRSKFEAIHSEVQMTLERPAEGHMKLAKLALKVKEQQPRSVLAEKKFETLDGMLQAYEVRLKPLENLEERYRSYPDPVMKARQLDIYQKLIGALQTLDHMIYKASANHRKQETNSHQEREQQVKQENTKDSGDQRDLHPSQEEQMSRGSLPKLPSNTSVPKVDEE